MYVRQLPATARTRLAMGQREGVWGLAEHLQALALDELRIGNWQRANSGAKSGQQSPRPRPVPRPGTGPVSREDDPERIAARKAGLQRAAERRAAIERGEIT